MFSPEEVERARRYHRPRYRALAAAAALGVAVPAVLAFSPWGDGLYRLVRGLPWPATAASFAGLVVAAGFLVHLPLSFWAGYVHEHRWGFSTQRIGGWLADRLKAVAVGLVITSAAVAGLVALARSLPRAWPMAAAAAGGGLILLLSFLEPVVFEPIFNRFAPLRDPELVEEILTLAARAGVPVRDVLVADASRRTRKENAYVSGLGRTRRVVVYDTLLAREHPRQIRLVAAHELGHRRLRHVAQGTVLGMAGTVMGVAALWALLRSHAVLSSVGANGPGDPRVVPFVLLAAAAMELLAMPFGAVVSRRWERSADRFSLDLTGDVEAFEQAHRALALSNLSDLDPPRVIYVLAFTHPTPPDRIADARRRAVRNRLGPVATGPFPATTG